MQLIDKNNKENLRPSVASIGFFDGVHLGHRFLIDQVKDIARKKNLPASAITFPIHPRKVLHSEYQPALLCGFEEKVQRLASTGIDYCISLDFDIKTSKLSAKEFMQQILKDKLQVDTLVIGYDHRFGHNRAEDHEDYIRYGKEIGIDVVLAKQYSEEYVSSSLIRSLLAEGNVLKVSRLLSYNYQITGKIVEGFKVGRTIGFPTANIQIWEQYKVVPAFGVYAVFAHVEGKRYGAMLYIGKRPTLHDDSDVSIEVNLFDFEGDLYNKELTAEFLTFVRPDEKFESIDILKQQLQNDKETVIKILKRY